MPIAILLALGATAQSTFDAAIVDHVGLKYPCDGEVIPVLRIQNQGTMTMSTCVVETWKNGVFQNSFNWVLASPAPTGVTRQPALPLVTGVQPSDTLEFRIISVNTVPDQDASDNIREQKYDGTSELSPSFSVNVQVFTDADPQETTWVITNATGQVVASGGPYSAPNVLEETTVDLAADGCYSFKLSDSGGNGMDQRSLYLPGHVKVVGLGTEVIDVPGGSFASTFEEGLRTGSLPWSENDAAISSIIHPVGPICGAQFQPVVSLANKGSVSLTSVQVEVRVDNVLQYTSTFSSLSLAPLASTDLTLPVIGSNGAHVITVRAVQPNGQPDADPVDDEQSGAYTSDGQLIKVRLRTDAAPTAISWTIYGPSLQPLAVSPVYTAPGALVTTSHCLPLTGGRYTFVLSASDGDGLNTGGQGSWELLDAADRSIIRDDGAFTLQSPAVVPHTSGYARHELHLPLGPVRPWETAPYAVCGNLALGVQSKVRCTMVSGASGYQWEFLDPNGGYRRRVSASFNFVYWTSMGGSAPLLGTRYLVRNRADLGAPGFSDDAWGQSCEMGWTSTATFCTGLIATPGSTFSCGATRTWGGSSRLWAQPVVGAVPYDANGDGDLVDSGDQPYAYHWSINGPGGYVKQAWTTSYLLPLNWTTAPMSVPGTYQVKVEVQVGGSWRGFCGSTCNVVIASALTRSASSTEALEDDEEVVLWPMPVIDGELRVSTPGMEQDQVLVRIHDMAGRTVFQRTLTGEQGLFHATLDVGMLAQGMHVIELRSGGQVRTKRFLVGR